GPAAHPFLFDRQRAGGAAPRDRIGVRGPHHDPLDDGLAADEDVFRRQRFARISRHDAQPFGRIYFFGRPYFLWNRSIRPAVSISFCFPVKNGWQAEQISRRISALVERVWNWFPQAQLTRTS